MEHFIKTSINQTGRSMVEMLGVLAIIGVLSAGGLAGYQKALARHRYNKTVEQVSSIVSNISTLFINEKDYAALSGTKEEGTINAVLMNIFPPEMIQEDKRTVLNPYKGNVYVYAVDYNGVENGAFVIDYERLPHDVAVAFAVPDTNVENRMMLSIGLNTESNN